MTKLTVSALSRELSVSRVCIYKAIRDLGIEKTGGEYAPDIYDKIRDKLMPLSLTRAKKDERVNDSIPIKQKKDEDVADDSVEDSEGFSITERLKIARQEYEYNRNLIEVFQDEIQAHRDATGRTTMYNHTGAEVAIPAITSLEKYIKLNIALSRLISELEEKAPSKEEDTPFE